MSWRCAATACFRRCCSRLRQVPILFLRPGLEPARTISHILHAGRPRIVTITRSSIGVEYASRRDGRSSETRRQAFGGGCAASAADTRRGRSIRKVYKLRPNPFLRSSPGTLTASDRSHPAADPKATATLPHPSDRGREAAVAWRSRPSRRRLRQAQVSTRSERVTPDCGRITDCGS